MRKIISKLVEIDASAEKIALGFAIGVFIGITPYWGFHTLLAFGLAAVLRGNTLAAILGVHIANPLTAPLFFGVTYWVGAKFLPSPPICFAWKDFSFEAAIQLFHQAPHILFVLSIGAMLVGIPMAGLSYSLVKWGVKGYKTRHESDFDE